MGESIAVHISNLEMSGIKACPTRLCYCTVPNTSYCVKHSVTPKSVQLQRKYQLEQASHIQKILAQKQRYWPNDIAMKSRGFFLSVHHIHAGLPETNIPYNRQLVQGNLGTSSSR